MKLCLLLAVGAFATQDVTPPVISLSLAGHPYTHTGWNNNQGTNSASRACIVGSDDTDAQCPNPVCTVTDHHDSGLTCKAPVIQQINYYAATASAAVNSGVPATIDRAQLGQYLLTYKAHDNSGNWADEIVFSFLFLDPFVPNLTGFTAEAGVGYNQDINGWAHGYAANCAIGVYTEACLNIYNGKNTWGYSYSSKTTVGTITATGETWNSKTFGPSNSVQPWAANDWSPATNPAAKFASANLESGICNHKFGESSAWACSRNGNGAYWAFDATATPVDNYRSTSAMTVYMKQDSAAWATAASVNLCMTGERTYVFHWYVDDLASEFGYKSKSNPQVHRVELQVTDNTKPRVMATKYGQTTGFAAIVSGSNGSIETTETQELECGTKADGSVRHAYVEAGFEVEDNSDGQTCGQAFNRVRCAAHAGQCSIDNSAIVQGTEGTYNVEYGYTDSANNVAYKVIRPVLIKDNTVPQLTLEGDCTLENSAGANINAGGNADADNSVGGLFHSERIARMFTHHDHCDKAIVTTVTIHTGACAFAAATNVQHCAGDVATSAPISGNFLAKFTWNGITGQRGAKTAGTQVFPEYEAGTYAIVYETKDQHFTSKACRQIENVDHTHPIIQILGSDVMTLEATHQGNYIDDGATCSDQVDGVISQNVEVSGDVVNLSKVGEYTITYNCKDSANNAAPPATRKVIVAQTSCPKCTLLGDATVLHEASFPYADAGATCSDVIDGQVTTQCSAGAVITDAFSAVTDCSTIVNIELTGNYNIRYRAQNTVGLWNDGASCRGGANEYYRLVKVQDTLRPVITLKYKNVVVAKGTHDTTGVGETTNTANYEAPGTASDTNPSEKYADPGTAHSLMAEETTSSVNGWVLGAIASAVAGLALLGYSTRRTAVATSVPV
jgi:hypothetical protein